MDKKKSFIVFAPEFLALSNHLNLKQRGELMTVLCEMVLYGEPMKPISQEISKAYDFMAESIKDNFSKYDAVCEKRRAIATKAASKRQSQPSFLLSLRNNLSNGEISPFLMSVYLVVL